ncbi:hypothetical protein MBLNU230_g3402t1 [Neophaeotheca triangularis]
MSAPKDSSTDGKPPTSNKQTPFHNLEAISRSHPSQDNQINDTTLQNPSTDFTSRTLSTDQITYSSQDRLGSSEHGEEKPLVAGVANHNDSGNEADDEEDEEEELNELHRLPIWETRSHDWSGARSSRVEDQTRELGEQVAASTERNEPTRTPVLRPAPGAAGPISPIPPLSGTPSTAQEVPWTPLPLLSLAPAVEAAPKLWQPAPRPLRRRSEFGAEDGDLNPWTSTRIPAGSGRVAPKRILHLAPPRGPPFTATRIPAGSGRVVPLRELESARPRDPLLEQAFGFGNVTAVDKASEPTGESLEPAGSAGGALPRPGVDVESLLRTEFPEFCRLFDGGTCVAGAQGVSEQLVRRSDMLPAGSGPSADVPAAVPRVEEGRDGQQAELSELVVATRKEARLIQLVGRLIDLLRDGRIEHQTLPSGADNTSSHDTPSTAMASNTRISQNHLEVPASPSPPTTTQPTSNLNPQLPPASHSSMPGQFPSSPASTTSNASNPPPPPSTIGTHSPEPPNRRAPESRSQHAAFPATIALAYRPAPPPTTTKTPAPSRHRWQSSHHHCRLATVTMTAGRAGPAMKFGGIC